jgi:hypothetical protein
MIRVCLLFIVLISANAFAQKNVKESVAFEKPPVIDGDVSDWTSDWWIDPDGKFFCNVANDAANLYVRLKVADDLTQQKLGLFGLSLRLNPSGKRKGKVGIKYPVGRDASEFKKKEPKENDGQMDARMKLEYKKELLGDVEVIELIGLTKQNIVASRLGLNNGVEAFIKMQDDGSYTYEAKIPFRAFKINKSEVSVLGVQFETGKYQPPQKTNPNNPQGAPGFGPSYGGSGTYRQPRVFYNNYQASIFSTPGYYFVAVKLK